MENNSSKKTDVIIIDDDREVTDVLEAYLEDMDIFRNIILARDGDEASQKLRNQKFACILLDINMPKRTGIDLMKELGRGNPNSLQSVIVVSGSLDKGVMKESVKMGIRHFLVKPFDQEVFFKKIRGMLDENHA